MKKIPAPSERVFEGEAFRARETHKSVEGSMADTPSAAQSTALPNEVDADWISSLGNTPKARAAFQRQALKPRYVECSEPGEVFADSIHTMVWDGQTVRIEFCVTRYREGSPPEGPAAEQHPTCRLVLTAPAAAALFNRLQQTMGALARAGTVSTPKPAPNET